MRSYYMSYITRVISVSESVGNLDCDCASRLLLKVELSNSADFQLQEVDFLFPMPIFDSRSTLLDGW